MDMGTVVALIKGLAPKTDPAVIEQAAELNVEANGNGIGEKLTPVAVYRSTRARASTIKSLNILNSDVDTYVYTVTEGESYYVEAVATNVMTSGTRVDNPIYVFASQLVDVTTAGIVISWELGSTSSKRMEDTVFTPEQNGYLYVLQEQNSVHSVRKYNPMMNNNTLRHNIFDGTYYNSFYVPNGGLAPTEQTKTKSVCIPIENGKTYLIETEGNEWFSACYSNVELPIAEYTESVKKIYYSNSPTISKLITTNTENYKYLYITLMRTIDGYCSLKVYKDIDVLLILNSKADDSVVSELSETVADHDERIETLEEGGVPISQEYIAEAVEGWLDEHPEATTTVPDGSLTSAKFNSEVFDNYGDIRHTKNVYDPDPQTYERRFGSNRHVRDYIVSDSENRIYLIGEKTVVDRATMEISSFWISGGWITAVSNDNTVMNSYFDTEKGVTARANSSNKGENNTFFNNHIIASSHDNDSGGVVVWSVNSKVIGNLCEQESQSGFSGITFGNERNIAIGNIIKGFGAGLEIGASNCIMSANITEGSGYGVHHAGPNGSRNIFNALMLLNSKIGFKNAGNQFCLLSDSIISADTLQTDTELDHRYGIYGQNLNDNTGLVMSVSHCIVHNYDTPVIFENSFAAVTITDCTFVCDSQTTLHGFNNPKILVKNCTFVNCAPENYQSLSNLIGCTYTTT